MTPIVTISRKAFKDLLAMVLGYVREGGGLLLGRVTQRGNIQIKHVTTMAHKHSDKSNLEYGKDDYHKARAAAHAMFPEWDAVGEWHVHPFKACLAEALVPQINDTDLSAMLNHEIELIAVTYPYPGYKQKANDFLLQRVAADVVCRVEVWYNDNEEARPCEVRLR